MPISGSRAMPAFSTTVLLRRTSAQGPGPIGQVGKLWSLIVVSLLLATRGVVADGEPSAVACGPGVGGPACEFRLQTVYHEHDPYESLFPRALDLQGWTPGAPVYDEQCEVVKPSIIVEVGVWKGASAVHLANCLKRSGTGVLFAVDTWTGALEFWTRGLSHGEYDKTRDLLFRHGMPTVFLTFLSNMVHKNVSEYVVPFPVTSRLAAEFFSEKNLQADLIHIDAAHEYEDVVEDIKRWWPLVRPCGVLMGDDYFQKDAWTGVKKAVDEFASQQRLHLTDKSPKWIVRKPGPRC